MGGWYIWETDRKGAIGCIGFLILFCVAGYLFQVLFPAKSSSGRLDKSLIGAVYVHSGNVPGTYLFDSLQPVVAFRIDDIQNDTVFMKYKSGSESFLDADFVFSKSCKCYQSKRELIIIPSRGYKDHVSMNVVDTTTIQLRHKQNGIEKTTRYKLSYIDQVDLKTHRNPYYSEEGFSLSEGEN